MSGRQDEAVSIPLPGAEPGPSGHRLPQDEAVSISPQGAEPELQTTQQGCRTPGTRGCPCWSLLYRAVQRVRITEAQLGPASVFCLVPQRGMDRPSSHPASYFSTGVLSGKQADTFLYPKDGEGVRTDV